MSSLDTAHARERLTVPRDAAEMMKEYLAYKDVARPLEQDAEIVKAQALPNINEHAQALLDFAAREGMPNLVRKADAIRELARRSAGELGLQMTKWTEKSHTWAMRELGKKYYEFLTRDSRPPDEQDKYANPFEHSERSQKVLNDIINHQLGLEAKKSYEINRNGWAERVRNEHFFAEAKDFMVDETDPDDPILKKFQTSDYGVLGATLRKAIPTIRLEREMNDPSNISPNVLSGVQEKQPRLIDTGAMPGEIHVHGDVEDPEEESDEEEDIENVELHREESVGSVGHTAAQPGTNVSEGVTPAGVVKASALVAGVLPLVGAWVAGKEFAKTSWDSVKGMYGVFKKLFKSGFSFKALNKSPDEAGTSKDAGDHGKKDGHDAGHAKHDDHGHTDHDHADHTAGGHSHAAGGHGKGGGSHGHAKKKSKGGKGKKGGGGHH